MQRFTEASQEVQMAQFRPTGVSSSDSSWDANVDSAEKKKKVLVHVYVLHPGQDMWDILHHVGTEDELQGLHPA